MVFSYSNQTTMHFSTYVSMVLCSLLSLACKPSSDDTTDPIIPKDGKHADVISVSVQGGPMQYSFSVGISSPDLGCNQYADWWEVVSTDGALLYRRVLAHSHVNEQPFVRSGGAVNIGSQDTVWVRAHMNTVGYGGISFKGTVESGFSEVALDSSFAEEVEDTPPLPGTCAF